MLRCIKGDVTNAIEPVILQGCNAQGKMNSGVAKAIRDKWPNVFYDYSTEHKLHGLELGRIYPVVGRNNLGIPGKIVINGITQQYYGREVGRVYVCYRSIREVLYNTRTFMLKLGIEEIAMPMIGSGLGGGNWEIIERDIQNILVLNGIKVWVYVP